VIFTCGVDLYVVADAGIFVDDGIADFAVGSDPDGRGFVSGIIEFGMIWVDLVTAHHDDVFQGGVVADFGSISDDAAFGGHSVKHAAFAQNDVFCLAADEFGGGEVGVEAVNGFVFIKEVKGRDQIGQFQVGFKEGVYGSDVFPVSVEEIAAHFGGAEEVGNDFLSEVICLGLVFQCIEDAFGFEDVDSHGGEAVLGIGGFIEAFEEFAAEGEGLDDFFFLWFFDKFGDGEVVLYPHEAKVRGKEGTDGSCGDGDVGFGCQVLANDVIKIHAVKLVPGEDEEKVVGFGAKVDDVLANGVGCALIPVSTGFFLFCGEDVYEATAKIIKFVGILNVFVKGGGIELGE